MITWVAIVSSLILLTDAHSPLQSDEYFEYYEDEKHHYMLEDPENSSSIVEQTTPPVSKVISPADTTADEELGLRSIQKEITSNNNVTHSSNESTQSPQLESVSINNVDNIIPQTVRKEETLHDVSSTNKPTQVSPTAAVSRHSDGNKIEETKEKILIKYALPLNNTHKVLPQENTYKAIEAIPTSNILINNSDSINNNSVPISPAVELKNTNESFQTGLKPRQSFHELEKYKIYRRSSHNKKPKVIHPFGETAVVHLADILTKQKHLYRRGKASNKKSFLIRKPLHVRKGSKESDHSNSNRNEKSYSIKEESPKFLNSDDSHDNIVNGGNVSQDIINKDKATKSPVKKYRSMGLGINNIDNVGDTILTELQNNSKANSSKHFKFYTSQAIDRNAKNSGTLPLSFPVFPIIKDNGDNPILLANTDETAFSTNGSILNSKIPVELSNTKSSFVDISSDTRSLHLNVLSDTTSSLVNVLSDTTSVPVDVSSDTTSLPVDVSSDTTSLPVDISSDTTSLPVNVLSDTRSLTMGVSADTMSLPVNVSSDTTSLPVNVSADTRSLHVNVLSDTTSSLVNVLSDTTSVPVDVSSDTTSLPVDVSSDTTSLPVNVSSDNTSLPVNVSADTTSLPVDFSSDTTSLPVNVSSDTTSLPVNVSADTRSLHVNVLSDTTSSLVNVLSDTTSVSVDVSADTTSLPVDVSSDTTSLPVDVSSDTTSLHVNVLSDTTSSPVDVSSDTTSSLVNVSSDTTSVPVDVSSDTTSLPMNVLSDTTSSPLDVVSDESSPSESYTQHLTYNNVMPASKTTDHQKHIASNHLLSNKYEPIILDRSDQNGNSTTVLQLKTRGGNPNTNELAITESITNIPEHFHTVKDFNSSLLPDKIKYEELIEPTPLLEYNNRNTNNSENIGTTQTNSGNSEIHDITNNFKINTLFVVGVTHRPYIKHTLSNYSNNVAEILNPSFKYPKTSIYVHNNISLDEIDKPVELIDSKNKSHTNNRLEIQPIDDEVLHNFENISYPLNYTIKEKYIPLPRNSSGFEILRKLNVSLPRALHKLPPRVKMITTKVLKKRRIKKPRRLALEGDMKPNKPLNYTTSNDEEIAETSNSSNKTNIALPVLENTLTENETSAEIIKVEKTNDIPNSYNINYNSTLSKKELSIVARKMPHNKSTEHIVTLESDENSSEEQILGSSQENKAENPHIDKLFTTYTTDHIEGKLAENRFHIKPEMTETDEYSEFVEGNTDVNGENTDKFIDEYDTMEPNETDMCEFDDLSASSELNLNNEIIDANRKPEALKNNNLDYTTSTTEYATKKYMPKKQIKDAKFEPSKIYNENSMSNFESKPSIDKRNEVKPSLHERSKLVLYLLDENKLKENSKERMGYQVITVKPDLSQDTKTKDNVLYKNFYNSVFETVIESKSITKNIKTVRINRMPNNVKNVEIVT